MTFTATVTDITTGEKGTKNAPFSVVGMLGAYPGGGNAPPATFEEQIGPIKVVSRYAELGFSVSAADAALAKGGQILAYCVATRTLGTWMEVAAGTLDAQIEATAKSIGALDTLVYAGYDNEWDGAPRQAEGGAMSTYAAAYEHWSAIMREYAPKAKLCCVPTGNNLTAAVAAAFPTPASFDIACFDPYDPSLAKGSPLATWGPPVSWLAAQKLAPGKQVALFETGVANTVPDASEAAWIAAMPSAAETLKLLFVLWFNANDTWDTIITPGSLSAAAFKAAATSPYFG